jgi:hypothetical protein
MYQAHCSNRAWYVPGSFQLAAALERTRQTIKRHALIRGMGREKGEGRGRRARSSNAAGGER